jgi:UDP-glucose:(heptosyl)LPS alpha-1,3-glucosyltransferase
LDRIRCRERITGRFGIASGERIILFVSMNFEIKGLDALIKALALLVANHSAPAFRLLVAGKGNVRKYRKLASSLGIEGRIIFTGVLPGAELPSLYTAADLYAMLSRFDTFGMVILEAMAASLPVLVSDRVGAKDLVRDGINGSILPAEAGPEEIACKLASLLREEVRDRMGRAARETARENTWDAAAARVAAIYEELLGNPPENG